MRELSGKKNLVSTWRELEKKGVDLHEMVVLAIGEEDYSLKEEIQLEIEKLIRAYDPCISCATHFLEIIWE